jgi:hypothetical protein
MKPTSYEAPHYAVFSSLPPLSPPFGPNILTHHPVPNHPQSVLPLVREETFHTHKQVNL